MQSNTSTPPKILLLEDDETLSEILQEFLEEKGYEVIAVYDGHEAVDRAYSDAFDLFLFDIKVPFQNGFDVLSQLRLEGEESPAVFISSLGSIEDLSRAYDAGCDDFLRKPFELQELEIRIKALLKRRFYHKSDEKIRLCEGIYFHLQRNRLYRNDEEILLSRKEGKILKTLLAHPGEIVSNEQLFAAAWDYDDETREDSLRTHIKNLRKILGKETITNIRAQGYFLAQS
ncbi:response regulator transcription factor [Sulfuricurvum sp.]|uniref:response regulator transcription factor n=1 Tax=Sulfuricurvum sp. TaxID=2025608 RepID=UPI002627ECA4|nr:response regulator transcription factor [Sulfuricurvum sp.]MDD3597756.1 response regulator transcription factor [Sulfuricurvum sp.]